MDAATNYDTSPPPLSLHSDGPESDFNTSTKSVKTSQDSETIEEIITKFALDVARISEKLTNLNSLSMRVELKESGFEIEAFVSDTDPDMVIKTLEYDLLSGFLDSEVKLLEAFISDLQMDKDKIIEFVLSGKHFDESSTEMVDMLHDDSEKSLKGLLEQVREIKVQTANFEKNLLRLSGNDQLERNEKTKMNMETVECQRHALKMLKGSLEGEIDLEKRVSELTQIEETLIMRLRLSEQEVVYVGKEAETTLEKFCETYHTSELLMESCKVLISKMKMLQLNLEGSIQRESQLNGDLLKLEERFTEERACTEDKCQELKDTNKKVVSLETEPSDVKVKLQHAETCYEASAEEESMLLLTIEDMRNVIEDLKNKVTQSKVQTENTEDMCIFLSESNSDIKNELDLVKSKAKSLETSLHQMKETKIIFAKNINLCSRFISDLVMQVTLERERLQNQISSLKQENKILVNHLKKIDEDPAVKDRHGDKASGNNNFTTENKEALSTIFEVEKPCNETVTDSTETARDIDARQLKTKHILLVLFILVMALLGVLLYQTQVKHIL